MKSLYIASSHSFQEQLEWKMPDPRDAKYTYGSTTFAYDLESWHEHANKLRLIPCRPNDKWEEGVLYEEGRGYKVEPISVLKRLPFEIEGSDLTRKRIDHVIPIASSPIK